MGDGGKELVEKARNWMKRGHRGSSGGTEAVQGARRQFRGQGGNSGGKEDRRLDD